MMKLQRIDYLQVAPLRSHSVQLLKARGIKQQQKVVVGDQRGTLQLISMRKSEPIIDFKINLATPINSIVVLANQESSSSEVIAVATAHTVKFFSIKGKLIKTLETNLVESILHLCLVSKDDVSVASNYNFNHYHDGKELNYFLSMDRINAMVVLPLEKVPSLTPILACQDGTVISLRDSTVRHRLPIDGVPNILHLYANDGGTSGEWVVVGTCCGKVCLVRFSRAGPCAEWIFELSSTTAVTCIDFYQLEKGVTHMIIGREDGLVEIFELLEVDDSIHSPNLVYSKNMQESIVAVRAGVIGIAGEQDFLVATQNGLVSGLVTYDITQPSEHERSYRSKQDNGRQHELKEFQLDIEQLEKKIFDTQIKSFATPGTVQTKSALSMNVIARMNYIPEKNVFNISIESSMSIKFVLVHCDVEAQIQDIETNLAIFNSIKTNEEKNPLLATFRCQNNTTRLDMIFVCPERGTSDELRLYISPKCSQPGQTNFVIQKKFQLTCLCLHIRSQPNTHWNAIPHNKLVFTGLFSLADAHNWMLFCLPNVPEKVPIEEEINFYFRHSIWETFLNVTYRKGEVVVFSDNLVALSHVREFMSGEATKKNIQLTIHAEVSKASTSLLVHHIHNKIVQLMNQRNQIALSAALKEAVTEQLSQDAEEWIMSKQFNCLLDSEKGTVSNQTIEQYRRLLEELYTSHRGFLGYKSNDLEFLTFDFLKNVSNEALVERFNSHT